MFALCLSMLATAPTLATLQEELSSALASLPHANAVVGACVIDLASGHTVFTRNADTLLIPASAMKVFTMAAALEELGPAFTFETRLATNGTDLFVIGDGDPGFGDDKLCHARGESAANVFDNWAAVLISRGMATAQGNLVGDLIIDESIFDDETIHPAWEPSDLGKWYAAPVGGLNINDNCLDITLEPSDKTGDLVRVSMQPDNAVARIKNKCRSGGKNKAVLHHPPDTFDYIISGRCTKVWAFGPVAFPDPGLLFAGAMRTALGKKGIHVTGATRRQRVRDSQGRLPASLTVLDIHRTPIADVLRRTGKNSQNLFAEALLKRAGYAWAKRSGQSGTDPRGSWALGQRAVLEVVHRAGIDATGLVVSDGSGLSRENRCTARQLAGMLAWLHRQDTGSLFGDSLSIAGVDGSLRKRLKDLTGRVRGKTGTMRGVRALAGYVGNAERSQLPARAAGGMQSRLVGSPCDRPEARYAFAVIFNGYKGPSTPYREIQDRICRILAKAAAAQRETD
ncbi:MAG: D-alanyl-D-alanine carboxypeptidase/D-alanyl-D-alanine-endopeptidase [Planctomycetes bacterium]|nr:D-alanyl-D-alanine carboxypeptidase/D-alanyl-D-alanine-endopeptidase [Planctomycetota bacterium]